MAQPGVEYDAQPRFDTGSPSKAPAAMVDLAARALQAPLKRYPERGDTWTTRAHEGGAAQVTEGSTR